LQIYFDPAQEGPLSDCTFEQLHELATKVYDRYMCSAAADDALGHSPRDNEIYGEPWGGEASEVVDEDDDNLPSKSHKPYFFQCLTFSFYLSLRRPHSPAEKEGKKNEEYCRCSASTQFLQR
jgi:hypothetical protein